MTEISDLSGRRKQLCLSEALLLAPKSNTITSKEEKFIKEALFTALHGMQSRYSDGNSVCPSVRLSVCQTRAL